MPPNNSANSDAQLRFAPLGAGYAGRWAAGNGERTETDDQRNVCSNNPSSRSIDS